PMQKLEWNNRGFSTVHALVAAAVSFYLVMISGLFSVDVNGIIIDRKSWLSDSMFGVSIGYFLTDLTMILWHFPSLGGKEFVSITVIYCVKKINVRCFLTDQELFLSNSVPALASRTFHVCNLSCFVQWESTHVHTHGPLH
uniref:TLC domain-containing protein n=1 Tax=Aegilops tauschii subsp. strangulata TaxID=200361 RepID=A0A453FT78_AEGTS